MKVARTGTRHQSIRTEKHEVFVGSVDFHARVFEAVKKASEVITGRDGSQEIE